MRQQLSEEVASYLRQAIMAGELVTGSPVRAEAIGEALEVSATPVREALQALRVEGFLELVPRKGFTVAPLTAADIRDVFEVHALIAGELAARSAEHAKQADIERMSQLHAELTRIAATGDVNRIEQMNHEFHCELYRLAGSDRLRWALSTFVKYVPRVFHSEIQGWPETMVDDHTAVIEALIAGDSAAARAAMQQHIRNSGERLAQHMNETREAGEVPGTSDRSGASGRSVAVRRTHSGLVQTL